MRQPWAELIRRRTPSFIESVIAWPRRIWTPTTASPAWGDLRWVWNVPMWRCVASPTVRHHSRGGSPWGWGTAPAANVGIWPTSRSGAGWRISRRAHRSRITAPHVAWSRSTSPAQPPSSAVRPAKARPSCRMESLRCLVRQAIRPMAMRTTMASAWLLSITSARGASP